MVRTVTTVGYIYQFKRSNYSLFSPLLSGICLKIHLHICTTTEVKIFPQMIVFPPIKNMTTKLNVTQAVEFLIPILSPNPTPLSAWSDPPPSLSPKTETNQHSDYLISSSLQFKSHPPHFSSCCLWSELDSLPTAISRLHWRSLNEGRRISPEDLLSVSPRLLSSPNSLLKYLKSQ